MDLQPDPDSDELSIEDYAWVAVSPDIVEELRLAGAALVDTLRDQLADGQVESLYSLQSASTGLQQQTAALVLAGESLEGKTEAVVDSLVSAVVEGLAEVVQQVERILTERLTAVVDQGRTELERSSTAAVGVVIEALASVVTALADAQTASTRDAASAREMAEEVLTGLRSQFEGLATASLKRVQTSTSKSIELLDAATEAFEERAQGFQDAMTERTLAATNELTRTAAEGAAMLGQVSASMVQQQTALDAALARGVAETSDALDEVSAALAEQQATVEAALAGAAEALAHQVAAAAEDARGSLEWVAQQGADRLGAATLALQNEREAAETAIEEAGAQVEGVIVTATATAVAQLQAAARDAGASLESVSDGVTSLATSSADALDARLSASAASVIELLQSNTAESLEQLEAARYAAHAAAEQSRVATEEHLAALKKQVQAAERREAAVAERLQAQVEAMTARLEETAGATFRQLQAVADDLARRDAQAEATRADEFARVLENVLSQSGGGGRKLRDRIRRSVESTPAASWSPRTAAAGLEGDPVTADRVQNTAEAVTPAPKKRQAPRSTAGTSHLESREEKVPGEAPSEPLAKTIAETAETPDDVISGVSDEALVTAPTRGSATARKSQKTAVEATRKKVSKTAATVTPQSTRDAASTATADASPKGERSVAAEPRDGSKAPTPQGSSEGRTIAMSFDAGSTTTALPAEVGSTPTGDAQDEAAPHATHAPDVSAPTKAASLTPAKRSPSRTPKPVPASARSKRVVAKVAPKPTRRPVSSMAQTAPTVTIEKDAADDLQ